MAKYYYIFLILGVVVCACNDKSIKDTAINASDSVTMDSEIVGDSIVPSKQFIDSSKKTAEIQLLDSSGKGNQFRVLRRRKLQVKQ